ncbi:unnamed protein product [Caenorhabditis brenneri]
MIVPILLLLLNVSYPSTSVGMATGARTTPHWIGQDGKPAAPFTEIQFEGTFTCSLNRTFCITGYIEEEDSWSSNEYMYRFPFYCTNKVSLPHNIRVNFTGGDGFYDTTYDPVVEIFHNCSENGKIKQLFHIFPPVQTSDSYYYQSYERTLNNTGFNHPFLEDYVDIGKKWEPYVFDWIYNKKQIVSYELSDEIPYFQNETLSDLISML